MNEQAFMKCPKCFSPMIKVRFRGIEVDRCTDCQGLWCDELERDGLLNKKDSERLDIGDARVGNQFNRAECVFCPRCDTRMVSITAPIQPHIRIEYCTVCAGCFLDSGEFRDLKHYTLSDFIKNLFVHVGTRRTLPPKFGQDKWRELHEPGAHKDRN